MLGLSLKLPVWQAPMAGVTTPELVAAVSNAGGLGNIGAGYLSGEQTEAFIREVKRLTDASFGINLFVPENPAADIEKVEKAKKRLAPYRKELGMEADRSNSVASASAYPEQLAVVLKEKVPVCSFTFGLPEADVVEQLKANQTLVIGTATTVEEAAAVEQLGMDAVVVQGSEAGGHRGSFQEPESLIGLMSLLPQAVQEVSIPVIAAGGIMNGQGVAAALCLGAAAVQMGTAFLVTKESGAHPLHKEAILTADETAAMLTKAFSGKSARGIANRFLMEMKDMENDLPPYPVQNALTSGIRKQAGKLKNREFLSLWCGQSPRLSRHQTVAELMEMLDREVKKAFQSGRERIKG
ncbi:NAD(P)H-dependent flavin oxidoreductase [Bacillus xiapuensis]|uniref:NAD(P)H-dependent flavin oxidoreductase n=1 Tax=Bacillus xiapuensis TaxID=2014075 RepID=UPI0022B7D95B|nr:nitronate monooxygenase [Bacillus xiapuensis]